jgi:hypothetical protein
MGSGAEDAVLEVVSVDDPKTCMDSLALLGEIGTEKSLPFIRQAQTSRSREVRLAASAAMGKVNKRRFAAKKAAKEAQQQP